ncbi:60S ribosomal protein L3 [Hordeum vulgare]|nr:60S ribosomal protein L3 [Hordeum vulgare]
MTPAQDPFYIVKDEIQDSIDKVQDTFNQWKQTPENTGEYVHLTRELLTTCESVQWQVDELEKAISVAERDPAYYGLNEVEIGKRRNWTSTARSQVVSVRRNVEAGKHKGAFGRSANPPELGRSKQHIAQDNDDFIASESDQQMLLMKRQDDELDALSASVQRIGGVGLTIHEELVGQEKLLGELSLDMETTSNRLDFVQCHRIHGISSLVELITPTSLIIGCAIPIFVVIDLAIHLSFLILLRTFSFLG